MGDGRKGVWLIKTYLDVSIAQLNGFFKGRMFGYKFSRHDNWLVIGMAVQRKRQMWRRVQGRGESCESPPLFVC